MYDTHSHAATQSRATTVYGIGYTSSTPFFSLPRIYFGIHAHARLASVDFHPSLACTMTVTSASPFPAALLPTHVTILSYGALVSEQSARLTFPALTSFRHVRVKRMRRVFAHPHLFLLSQGLIDASSSRQLASLSAEPQDGAAFVAVAFDGEPRWP